MAKTNFYTQGRGAGFTQPNTPTPTPTPTTPGQAGFDVYGGAFAGRDNAKTYGAFWDKYGASVGNPMLGASQNIYNSAGTNAGMGGQVFNQASNLYSMNPQMGLGNMNQAQSMYGNINPYLQSGQLPQAFNYQGMQTPQAMNYGDPMMGQSLLDQASAYNPMQAASDRFAQMQSILDPYRQRDIQRQDQTLFSRGQLGSTGGGIQQQSLRDSFATQDNQNLLNAIQSSEGTQNNLYNQGMGMAGLGLGAQGQAFGQQYNNAGLGMQGQAQYFGQGLGLDQYQTGLQQQGIGNALNLGGAFGNLGMNQSNLGLNSYNSGLQGQLSALGSQQGAYGLQGILPNTYNNLLQSSQNWGQQWQQNRAAQDNGGLGGALGTLGGAFLGGMAGPMGTAYGQSLWPTGQG